MLPFEKPEQSDEQTIVNQLAKIGVRPEEIDIVVNSHLHFDHCSGNKYFPGARFIMSKSELRHAFVPDPWERLGYDRNLVDMPGARMELLELSDGYEYEVVSGRYVDPYTRSLERSPLGRRPTDERSADGLPSRCRLHPPQPRRQGADGSAQRSRRSPRLDDQDRKHRPKIGGKIFYSHDPDEYKTYKKAPEFYGE